MAHEPNRCSGCWRSLPRLEGGQTPNFCPHCQFPLKPVAGLYHLDSKLGAGAFGTVYRSTHVVYGTTHAVKIMRWDVVEEVAPDYWGRKQKLDKQREFEQRFQQEVKLTTELAEESWHIVRIDSAGSDPVHGLYYVMELLEGAPLNQFVAQWPAMSRRIAFSVMEQVCLAVAAAHNKGVIHRDLKPENIILLQQEDQGRFVKILDFGIAKVLGEQEMNLTSRPVGTPLYMAPEQCANKKVDQRTDIYALGCLFYHLMTGHPPFDSHLEIPQLMLNHIQNMPPLMTERCPELHIPPGLERVVMRALAKDPEARYSRVEEFWAAIHPFSSWQAEAHPSQGVTGADTIVTVSSVPEPVYEVPQEEPSLGWSMGDSSWNLSPELSDSDVLWDERHFQRSRFGWGGFGFVFVAILLTGLWWVGNRNIPHVGISSSGSRSGSSPSGSAILVPKNKQSLSTRNSSLASQPGTRRPHGDKVASNGASGDKVALNGASGDKVASNGASPRKSRLSRLKRFLRQARQKRKRRLRQKRKRRLRQNKKQSSVVHVRRSVRPKRRTARHIRHIGRPRLASVSLPSIVDWPGAQQVGVPAGQVMTGSSNTTSQLSTGRVLSLGRGFWMWRTEVTQAQFQSLMGYNPSHFKACGKRCPVENVSWHEAAAFCNALSRQQKRPLCFECTGKGRNVWCMIKRNYWGKRYYRCKGWRLPTEIEWEYAYRAGTPAPYYSGKCLSSSQANFNGSVTASDCPKGRYRKRTMTVGSFKPNAWGIYDMAGNVWEWVYDSYQPSLPTKHNAVRIGNSRRVVRGGGWYSPARECRATARESYSSTKRGIILGFRPTRGR